MTTDFTVTYTLTAEVEARARRVDFLRKKMTWVVLGASALFFIAFAIFPPVLAVLEGVEPLNSLRTPFLYFAGLGVFWLLVYRFYPQGIRAAGADKEVSVSDEGISSKSPVAHRLLYWVNFTNALETGDFFLLRTGGQNVWVVPKSNLGDSAILQGLRDLIRVHIPDARLLDQPD